MEEMEENATTSIYNNGKIYKLQCDDGFYYIGSTTNSLSGRLGNHKQDSKKYPKRGLYEHINTIGWNHVQIEKIEDFPCKDKNELSAKEDFYINKARGEDDHYCLNINRAIVTKEERKLNVKKYYEEHKESIINQHREYVKENKEKIHEYRKVYNEQNAEDRNAYSKKWKEENPEQAAETRKQYYETHKEEILEKCKRYVEENKEVVAERKRKWTEENKDKLKENNKEYRNEKKEVIQEKGKQYYEENKELIRQKQKEYNEKNKEKLTKQQAEKRAKVFSEPPIQCDCGGHYHSIDHIKHFKTNRHTKYENVKNQSKVQKGDE